MKTQSIPIKKTSSKNSTLMSTSSSQFRYVLHGTTNNKIKGRRITLP